MTSYSAFDATTRNSSSISPIERRTTSSTYSSSNQRYSNDSSEAGESSRAASNRDSFATSPLNEEEEEGEQQGGLDGNIEDKNKKDGRSSHRVHNKGRSGGSFLLSNSLFHRTAESSSTTAEHQPRSRGLFHDLKGKSAGKKHNSRQLRTGIGSPLASNVPSVPTTQEIGEEDIVDENATPQTEHGHGTNAPASSNGLDVDAAQIVNLALNLSESRRIASKRNVSTPVPLSAVGFRDEMAVGGSLRHHLQQHRRVPRNVSPKPDKNERTLTNSQRMSSGVRISPLPIAFDATDTTYNYHFSSSTLARAAKAKKAIELMAQYRRLLQYVPPLKSGTVEKARHTSPGGPGFSSPGSGSGSTSEPAHRVFGRHYNPLQYIRNRKVRARARISIDGEAQEFGNVHKVSWWVDEVSKAALHDDFVNGHHVALPPFSRAIEDGSSPHTSPRSAGSKNQTVLKLARPRIDWTTDPADMLADIFWMEQGDNKLLIEDRNGMPIFSRPTEPRQSIPRRPEDFNALKSPDRSHPKNSNSAVDLRIDTRLPDFRSSKLDSDKHLESTASKVRHKLHDATHTQHGSSSASRERSRFLRSRSRSSSDSSDSEHIKKFPRRKRSGTDESQDNNGKDILEKQMLEMLAKESGDASSMTPTKLDKQSSISIMETSVLPILNSSEKSDSSISLHRKKTNTRGINKESPTKKRHPFISTPPGRPSLDVPGISPRNSLDGLDTTAPNSPQIRASRLSNFVPGIGLDLSSPRSRRSSPSRKRGLSRVRSKINSFREHSGDRGNYEPDISRVSIDSIGSIGSRIDPREQIPETSNGRNRSMSPTKKLMTRDTDDSTKSFRKQTSLRKGKGEDSSGIRGLFKGSRGPVARVSEFLWKKEWNNSATSTDESDMEDHRTPVRDTEKIILIDKNGSNPVDVDVLHDKTIPTYIHDMPTFKSPFENRGRSTQSRKAEAVIEAESLEIEQPSRSRLEPPPPRIEIDGVEPVLSPEREYRRVSDVSDVSTRKGSYVRGIRNADARLNVILGYPGHKAANTMPVTGLSHIKANENSSLSLDASRRWSHSDSGVSVHRGPMTRRDIAYVKARLYSSGIKSMYLTRQAAEPVDFRTAQGKFYNALDSLTDKPLPPVPRSQQHILAANIIRDDVQLSIQLWQESQKNFSVNTIQTLLNDMGSLHSRLVDNLTPMVRKAADDADEVSKDLVTSQILEVNKLTASMDKMIRRRRRRLRWVRRGGWVMVEWALVGVMWYVWFMVVLCRVIMGIGRGAVGAVKWLFWM